VTCLNLARRTPRPSRTRSNRVVRGLDDHNPVLPDSVGGLVFARRVAVFMRTLCTASPLVYGSPSKQICAELRTNGPRTFSALSPSLAIHGNERQCHYKRVRREQPFQHRRCPRLGHAGRAPGQQPSSCRPSGR
jgi:hypothetical protein